MIDRTQCPKCESKRIIPNAQISIPQYFAVNVPEHPDAVLFRGTHLGHPSAWVCGTCGYIEFYVHNPEELYAAYASSQGQRIASSPDEQCPMR